MPFIRSLALTSAILLASPSRAGDPIASYRINNLGLSGVPAIDPAIATRLARFNNARGASFDGWSGEGALLIRTRFASTAQVHRVSKPGGARRQLTFLDEPVANSLPRPRSPDQFVFTTDDGGDENYAIHLVKPGSDEIISAPDTRNEGLRFSRDGSLLAWGQTTDSPVHKIIVADPDRPETRRAVFEAQGFVYPLDVSRDGKRLLVVEEVSGKAYRVQLVDLQTLAVREVNPSKRQINYSDGFFAPDGKSVMLITDDGSDTKQLVEYDLATNKATRLSPRLNWDVEAADLSPKGTDLVYSVNEGGISRIFLRDLSSGREVAAPGFPIGELGNLRFSPDGTRIAASLSTADSPSDIWVWNTGTGATERWTESEIGLVDPAKIVVPTLVETSSFDGTKIPAFVYRPGGISGKAPVIIVIHGGPDAQSRPLYSSIVQYWLQELGAAVVAPNVRGSEGYGRKFLSMDDGMLRHNSVKDIGAVLDWIATQPDLDPSRVVVYGASYGGFMVLSSLVEFGNKLAGGVDIVGPSNLATFLDNTEEYGKAVRRAEYGDERDPKTRAYLNRIAPITNVERIRDPLLVIHGRNDPRVPYTEAESIVQAVRGQGNDVWYLLADDEGHGFQKKQNLDVRRQVETMFLRRIFEKNARP